jgi:CBS-domain-containing membrane protein
VTVGKAIGCACFRCVQCIPVEETMKVQDAMSRGAMTCKLGDTLERAAQLMWELDLGCLPVVDDEERVVSMITDRDICMAAYTQGRRLREVVVRTAASNGVCAVKATDSLAAAEMLMRKHQLRRLPVVDAAGRAVGMLAINDLVRLSDAADHRGDELAPQGVVHTLASIGRSDERSAMAAE